MTTDVRLSHWPSTLHVGHPGADAVVFDDIQVSLSTARLPAVNAPTWVDYDYGLGGPTFNVLAFDVGEYIDFKVQTSHAMRLNSILDNHIHWTIPSNSAPDTIKFQIDVVAAGIGELYAKPTGSPFVTEHVLDGTESARHNLLCLADIPAVNTTVSSMYQCKLTRVASSSEYGSRAYIDYNDGHYRLDTIGSRKEDSKV